MKNIFYIFLSICFISLQLNAQNIPYPIETMPDTLDLGIYETVTEQIVAPSWAFVRLEAVPAQFEIVSQIVTIKEGYSGYKNPVYKTIEEQILTKEAYKELTIVPQTYKIVQEKVILRPARTVFVKRKNKRGGFVNDCYNKKYDGVDTCNWQPVALPPKYTTIPRQGLKTPAKTTEKDIAAIYQTIQKQVIDWEITQKQAVGEKRIEIEPEYQTITKEILVNPAYANEIDIPGEYWTSTTRKLVKKRRFMENGTVINVTPSPQRRAATPHQNGKWIKANSADANALSQNPEDAKVWLWMPNDQGLHEPQEPNRGEQYDQITENNFGKTTEKPLSTFSIDVDKASYSNIRRFINSGQLPPKDAVRIEEMVNYFDYDYPQPKDKHPFSINTEMGKAPWNTDNYLLHIGLQGKEVSLENIPANNLVFLLDVSGSMSSANKLPLLKESLKMLARQMRPQDKTSIVVYAGAAGLVLPPTAGIDKMQIFDALDRLNAGGSTAGGAGIELAYKIAQEQFIQDGNNRVILATDGDFNVGISSDEALVKLIEAKRETGVYLTVLGFGTGNYHDSKMEKLADKGNGNYAYIDNIMEAKKVLYNELSGTLYTIAKDVKIQVEFNPAKVASYRLIGYENRLLAAQDFNDDTKDAGEIGAGHTVTALYEIVPLKGKPKKKDLKLNLNLYKEAERKPTNFKQSEWVNIHFRYKPPTWDSSKLLTHSVTSSQIAQVSDNFTFSAAVAALGMLLRDSEHKGKASFGMVQKLSRKSKSVDKEGYRKAFLEMVEKVGRIKN